MHVTRSINTYIYISFLVQNQTKPKAQRINRPLIVSLAAISISRTYLLINMAFSKLKFFNTKHVFAICYLFALFLGPTNAHLSPTFYALTCPTLESIVRAGIRRAIQTEARTAASILRLFFHDCFVNGCDASILLVDSATFIGEQNAAPNKNSVRGYGVIDKIKTKVEKSCPGVVSCADILAIAAKEAVVQTGGPTWLVPLGRRDARTASKNAAESNLPSWSLDLKTLTEKFANKGLSATDMTALSGGHTLGLAQCSSFRDRIYNATNIDSNFATIRRATCPASGGDSNLAPFDSTQNRFDNRYFTDLVNRRGLLKTDQDLFNGGSQDDLVRKYSTSSSKFFEDFANAMVKMSKISPLTGTHGEIRKNCAVVN